VAAIHRGQLERGVELLDAAEAFHEGDPQTVDGDLGAVLTMREFLERESGD